MSHHVHGLDFSPEMLKIARTKAATTRSTPTLTQGDAAAPPLPAGSFDVVLSRHVLWAMRDPVALAEQLAGHIELCHLDDDALWDKNIIDEGYLLVSSPTISACGKGTCPPLSDVGTSLSGPLAVAGQEECFGDAYTIAHGAEGMSMRSKPCSR